MRPLLILPLLFLAACNGDGANDPTAREGETERSAYAGVGVNETLRFTGTEPFWGGTASGTTLTYTTPEDPAGATIPVQRFAGNNGLAFTGHLRERGFDMAVTEAPCGDGMSDRTYPFTVTLRIGGEVRNGCGWTDRRSFEGAEASELPGGKM
jgi:uncharacterized membrane protein